MERKLWGRVKAEKMRLQQRGEGQTLRPLADQDKKSA